MGKKVILEARNLKKYFPVESGLFKKQNLKAVDDISLKIYQGETFGLVGESGCGKSTLGRTLMRLYEPTSGSVLFYGTDITALNRKELRPWNKKMQIIFQDPYSSLNPSMNVREIIAEPLKIHTRLNDRDMEDKIAGMLDAVGLSSSDMDKFPHEFSGGQCQRIGIARALSVDPEFILCDEPISALDVSVQAQVVNLLKDLQEKNQTTYLFVAHNLSMVKYIADRIGIMYLGKLVEIIKADEIYSSPAHPYTKALIKSIPDFGTVMEESEDLIKDEIPSPTEVITGCRFKSRCPYRKEICDRTEPELLKIDEEHYAACHFI